MSDAKLRIPTDGEPIAVAANGKLQVPDRPIVPHIAGDGIGQDVSPVMRDVVDAAVASAYGSRRRIAWLEVYAGERAVQLYGPGQYCPEETLDALRRYVVSIKGPLTTPVGGGIRSLNVAIRQSLDLYACVRPVRYFQGVTSPVREPQLVDMVVFRENTEDIYAGIEWPAGSDAARRLIRFLETELDVPAFAHPQATGLGIKPMSAPGTERLVRKALQYALDQDRRSLTLVHKGNIMKYTEGAFRDWGYALARREFGAQPLNGGPWLTLNNPKTGRQILIKDVIADNFLQQSLLAPQDYDVIATPNLNGDYISDALAAQVGGIGIAPGGNIGDGLAVFEATHGTAPGFAGKDLVNPGSLILSAEMMLRYLGWTEAADRILRGMERTIAARRLTFDLAGVRPDQIAAVQAAESPAPSGVRLLGTRAFGTAVIAGMAD